MLSVRSLAVLWAACLVFGGAFAQDVKPVRDPLLSSTTPAVTTPSEPLTPEVRGDIYMARKMYREAIETYEKAPQNSAVIWNKIGIAYHQLLQLDAAMKRYKRAMHLDRKYAEPVNNAGTIYYAERRYGKAVKFYKKALKLEPDSASIYSNLGTGYFAEKKYKEALVAYDKALRLDPEIFEHHNTYGVLLQERTVDERAKFHYYLARIYAKEGQNDRALEYIRKALEEGFKDRKKLMEDPEFAALRETPQFQALLKLKPRVL